MVHIHRNVCPDCDNIFAVHAPSRCHAEMGSLYWHLRHDFRPFYALQRHYTIGPILFDNNTGGRQPDGCFLGMVPIYSPPAYTGGWIIAVGVGLELNTWMGTLIIAVGLWAIYYHRIRVEEEELVARLGSPYEEYRRESWRMFWGIW